AKRVRCDVERDMTGVSRAALAMLALLTTIPAHAQDDERPPAAATPVARRDEPPAHAGFFLRAGLGFGIGSGWVALTNASRLHFDGFGSIFTLDVGGAPAENVMIYARGYGMTPDGALASDSWLQVLGAGAGIMYYAMPFDLYGGAALHVDW